MLRKMAKRSATKKKIVLLLRREMNLKTIKESEKVPMKRIHFNFSVLS